MCVVYYPHRMHHLFVIYDGNWNEVDTVYESGVMGGLDVDETITYDNLVNALYMFNIIDPYQFHICYTFYI